MIFKNRRDAGVLLCEKLKNYVGESAVVLALPRGGVPVAVEVARFLQAPLEVLIVRKIGAPSQTELAVGAICEDQKPVWNKSILHRLALEIEELAPIVKAESERIKEQRKLFRSNTKLRNLSGETVIVVDDGLATGATMLAAVEFLKTHKVGKLVIAVPVAASTTVARLKNSVDHIAVLQELEDLGSVGQWYDDFAQVSDEEVISAIRPRSMSTVNK